MEKINVFTILLIALRFLWNIFAPVTLVFVSINDFITDGISDCIKNINLVVLFMFILGVFFVFVTWKYLKNIDKSYFQLVYTICNFALFFAIYFFVFLLNLGEIF